MNKKFLVVALMAALSTVGYAGEIDQNKLDYVYGKVGDIARETSKNIVNIDRHDKEIGILKDNVNQLENTAKGNKVAIETVMGSVIDLEGKVKENLEIAGQTQNNAANALIQNSKQDKEIENLKTQVGNNTAISTENSKLIGNLTQEVESVKGDVDFVKGEVERVDGKVTDLQNKVETGFENLQNQVSGNSQALGEMGQDIVALEKENDKQNDRLDAAEDRLDLGERIDGVQNQQIGNLQSQNVTQDKNILDNKNQIAANKAEQDKVNAKQEKNNADQQAAIEANKNAITETNKQVETNKNDIADLRQDFAKYDGRLSGLEKKVDNLDNKMNKGLSLMAAMNAVDFQNVQTGEMAIGAGVGHYGNAQSVALGVAYSPVEDLTVNAKYSVTAGDVDSFALGAGATYKFKVGR